MDPSTLEERLNSPVAELRSYARSLGISGLGTREELGARIRAHFEGTDLNESAAPLALPMCVAQRVFYTHPYTPEELEGVDLTDAITYEEIPVDRLVLIREGETTYTFDLDTLYRTQRSARTYSNPRLNPYLNPFTRQPLSREIVRRVQVYAATGVMRVPILHPITLKWSEVSISRTADIGELVLEILRSETGGISQALRFDLEVHIDSRYVGTLYDHPLTDNLTTHYALDGQFDVTLAVCRTAPEVITRALAAYGEARGNDDLVALYGPRAQWIVEAVRAFMRFAEQLRTDDLNHRRL